VGWEIWTGESSALQEVPSLHLEEADVETAWGASPYDARAHPLFPFLSEHLAGHSRWAAMDKARETIVAYRDACNTAVAEIEAGLRVELNRLDQDQQEAMAQSLLAQLFHRAAGYQGGLAYSHTPEPVVMAGQRRWYLRLGAWSVGPADKSLDLEPLARVHEALALSDVSTWSSLTALARTHRNAEAAIEAFQHTLLPEFAVARAIKSAGCGLCV